jgi:hypothetical protein
MQMKESNKMNQNLVDKIIKVAYGDAGIFDWLFIHLKAVFNKEIKSILTDYKNTAKAVHHLNQEDVPDHIIENVNARINSASERNSIDLGISYGLFSFFGKKAIPATVFGIIIASVISFFLLREPEPTQKYSKAEIELAEIQLKQSLAIVGRAFQKAEKSFNEEILDNQINKNLNRGYYLVNNILTGG